jgi:signal transduction histidine kinase
VKKNCSQYGNGEGVYVGGSSAGGYLSMMLCFNAAYLGAHGIDPTEISGWFHDAGQPTKHFTVLKYSGEDERLVIIDETARLSELVNDLLDLSQIQAGVYEPDRKEFDLSSAVREVMHRYDTLIKHKGYLVSFEADSEAWVYADHGMLLQVIYNLINNAINYTGADKCVSVKQTLTDGRVRISVSDTGRGIAPEEMPLIWDRYYKVDKVHRMAMIGTGLGLSIVKTILETHQATYGVNSRLGEGATFWFELPTIEPPIPDQAENIQTEE